MRFGGFAWVLVGCAGSDAGTTAPVDTGPTEPVGACGDVSEIVLTITGRVEDGGGAAVSGAELALEERNWRPGSVLGTTSSGSTGEFSLAAADMTVVEDCWGTAVSYWLVGTSGELSGERPMNPTIMAAWEAGESSTDLGAFPLVLH